MESFFQINGATVATWFVAFITLCLDVIVFLGGKERSTRYFAITVGMTVLWIIMMGFHIAYPIKGIELETGFVLDMIPRIMHSLGLFVGFFFFHFTYSFPDNKKIPLWVSAGLASMVLIMIFLIFYTNLVVGNHVDFLGSINVLKGNKWSWQLGPLISAYSFFLNFMFIGGLLLLFFKQKKLKDNQMRLQVRRMILPLLGAILAPGIADIILPFFGNFSLNWMAGVAQIFWVLVVGYAVIKHNQMNVKTVFTELLILVAMGLLFINIFI